MEIATAPAVSLYLRELFFDGYNIKQRREQEKDARLLSKRKAAVAFPADTSSSAAAAAAAEEEAEVQCVVLC
jgi:hypothetical protein